MSRRSVPLLCLPVVWVLLYHASLQAEVHVVPHEYPSIQDAVHGASEGDTILIGPVIDSTYVEGIGLDSASLTFMSAYGPRVTQIKRSFSLIPGSATQNWKFHDSCRVIGLWFRETNAQCHIYVSQVPYRVEGCVFLRLTTGSSPSGAVYGPDGYIIRNNFLDLDRPLWSPYPGESVSGDSVVINSNLILRSMQFALSNAAGTLYPKYNAFWQNSAPFDTFMYPVIPLEGNIEADPLLLEPTMTLAPGSPAIDAGDPDLPLDADGTRADMGLPANYPRYFPFPAGLTYGPDAVGKVVTSFNPVFGWIFADSGTLAQAAYEVEVGTDADWSIAELWQSGTMVGSVAQIPYGGSPLADRTWYFVRVRLQNGYYWGPWRQGRFAIRTSGPISVPGNVSTIHEAVDMSLDGDSVLVGPGTYSEEIRILRKSVCLLGSGSEVTLLNGEGLREPQIQVIGAGSAPTVIRGFTIYHSNAVGGAVMITDSANAVLENCCVSYNRAFRLNTFPSRLYGAINVFSNSLATLKNNRIHHNSSYRGAAISCLYSQVILEGNLIHDNVSETTGGAIFAQWSRTEWRHNTVVYNFADLGNTIPTGAIGGIHTYVRNLPSVDSTLSFDNIVAWNSLYGFSVHYANWPPQYQVDRNVFYGHLVVNGGTYPYESEPEKWAGNLQVDPLLGSDFLPLPGSPVLGAATDGGNIGLDSAVAICSPLAVGPECGNGLLEPGEACDDGNLTPGDGCDAVCRPEIKACLISAPGDMNASESVSSGDVIVLVNYVFKGGAVPLPCEAAGDVSCSGAVTSADIIHLVNFVFKSGDPPCDYCNDSPIDCP